MEEQLEKFRTAVQAASEEYDADIYFFSGGIDDQGYGQLV
jgi:hypothetical protein